MKEYNILIAGSGGQGVQTIGKLMTEIGMENGFEVSFIPSYGPEMRGGTSNCGVNISEEPIASPLVVTPTDLVALNLPSLDKYENSVAKGGIIIMDSSLIERKVLRDDVTVYAVPATQLASDNGMPTLANMILVGKLLKALDDFSEESVTAALKKVISAKRADMMDINRKAMQIGADY